MEGEQPKVDNMKTRHLANSCHTQRETSCSSCFITEKQVPDTEAQPEGVILTAEETPDLQQSSGQEPVPPEATKLGDTGPAACLGKQGRHAGALLRTQGPLAHISMEYGGLLSSPQ